MRARLLLSLLIAGCTAATEPDLGGMPIHSIAFDGPVSLAFRSERVADSIIVTAEFHNAGAEARTATMGLCSFAVRGVSRSGAVWDNRLPADAACPDVGRILSLAPGESRSLSVYRSAVADLLGRSPPGVYDVRVFIRIERELQAYSAGAVRL